MMVQRVVKSAMSALVVVVCVCGAAAATVGPGGGNGTGCEKRLNVVCPGWSSNPAMCLDCVKMHLKELEANCTEAKAALKCKGDGPTPSPPPTAPEPPLPPITPIKPRPGAMRPHVVLWVTDDQGYANIGFHNPENVITPHADELASNGIILERHYTYRWCAPTRSALMTGRLPYHVFQLTDHVDRGFSMMPAKLRQVGYRAYQVGKWHLGAHEAWMTPVGRGFETSLGYLGGGEDHYTQISNEFGCTGVDLYNSTAPAYGMNGTYGAFIYGPEASRIVQMHDPSEPLFIYVATQVMHAPQEVPVEWSNKYPSPKYDIDYAIMNGMASLSDMLLGNVTGILKSKGMWENTLMIYTSDNGGPAGRLASGHSGNNWPLRGGKTNFFEGGIRVTAFLSGGAIPESKRGTTLTGYMHVADWYPTVIGLAGGDPTDNHDGVPPVDGYDMWPYITGNTSASPRTEIMIGTEMFTQKTGERGGWNGALISGDYKLILGIQSYDFWQGPNYPNSSTNHNAEKTFDCGNGCLFNIQKDPSEYVNLASTMPDKLAEMRSIFIERNKTAFEAPKYGTDEAACLAYKRAHQGFVGPYGH